MIRMLTSYLFLSIILCHVTISWHHRGVDDSLARPNITFRTILKSPNARLNTDLRKILPTMSSSNRLDYPHSKSRD